MEKKFPSYWLNDSWKNSLLAPLSWLFSGLSILRKHYQQQWNTPYKSPIPLIVVGNIMLGGTGKTPMVLHIAKLCRHIGLHPAIISKGYGGTYTVKHKGTLLVLPEHSPQEVGDEPRMMADAEVGPVVIAYSRAKAIKWIVENCPHIHCIISDDGLNDYSLSRDIEVVMIDGMRGLGNQRVLPSGPLRESPERLLSADYTVITQPQNHLSRKIKCHAKMTLRGDFAINLYNQKRKPLSFFADKKPLAIAGIGHPERYFKHLSKHIPNLESRSFADHHDYSKTLDLPTEQSILMTSKDAVKLRDVTADNYWEVPVEAELSAQFNQHLGERIQKLIK